MFQELPNITSILLMLAALAGWAVLAWSIYRKSLPPVYPTPYPLDISGGLSFIGFLLFIRAIYGLKELAGADIFDSDYWSVIGENYAVAEDFRVAICIAIFLQFLLLSYAVAGNGFLIWLYFRKRDIFPRALLTIVVSIELLGLITILFSKFWLQQEALLTPTDFIQIPMHWLIWGAICWYIFRSERSKQTFVLPHPSLINREKEAIVFDFEDENGSTSTTNN